MERLTDMSDRRAVIRAMEANMREKLRYFARLLPATMRTFDDGDVSVSDSGFPTDTFNTAFGGRAEDPAFAARARRIRDYFAARNLPMAWWFGPSSGIGKRHETLVSLGFRFEEEDAAMARPLAGLPAPPPLPDGLVIRQVGARPAPPRGSTASAPFADFATVLAGVFDPPDRVVPVYYRRIAESGIRHDEMRLLVAYLEGRPVASGCCFLAAGVAGIFDIATVPAARGRGIGSAVVHAALAMAKAAGQAIAVLQASPDGLGIYSRLGFAPLGEFDVYSRRPPAR